ncbi:MAG: hypothetical protein LLF76_02475, partial [Planctomycetaceae bacterium]|nr:hypothetical protein [Planctomycetaceae bacterium]
MQSDSEWIEDAVKRFRQGCEKLWEELSSAAEGTFLDASDASVMENIEPLLKEVQQKAIQEALEHAQKKADYRRFNKCKKKMRHKGRKALEFIIRFGNFSLQGTYYRCGCSNSKSVSVLVSAGRKFSRVADELVIRYAAS